MSVLRPRTRLVYFRVSEEEYMQLAGACQTYGLRSISDAARMAVQQMLDKEIRPAAALENQALNRLADLVCDLNSRVGKLVTALGGEEQCESASEKTDAAGQHHQVGSHQNH